MTTMIAEVYDALIEAGASQEKARKAAEAIVASETVKREISSLHREMATKTDLRDVELRLIRWVIGVGVAPVLALGGLMITLLRTAPHG